MNVDLGHSVLETLTEYVTVCDTLGYSGINVQTDVTGDRTMWRLS